MSIWLQGLLYTVGGITAIALLIGMLRSKRPIRALIGSGAQGICALAAVNIAGAFTGISLGLNIPTFIVCSALGIPGVTSLLLLKLIFNS